MKKTFKTQFLVAAALFVGVATTATAKSWRVNSDVTKNADFTSLNAVINSSDVVAGDTVYLDPGCILIDKQTLGLNKPLTIIGPGYMRADAPHQQAVIKGVVYIDNAGTKIEGVVLEGEINIRAQYVTIERCKTGNIKYYSNDYQTQYTTIRQCYILGGIWGYGNTANQTANWTIENNIIIRSGGHVINSLYSPNILNNYICSTSGGDAILGNITNATIQNNILIHIQNKNYVFYNVLQSIITNNVLSCTEGTYTTIGENYYLDSTDEKLVFAWEGTNDQRYQLKADSPAKGYGVNGVDCGPYAGATPYVISGLPSGIPYYTKANIGTKAKDGKINVTLNIKMQDE